MPGVKRVVIGGVDTHKDVHVAVVIDRIGKVIDRADFVSEAKGCQELIAWMGSFGHVAKVGVEGTGAYGAGLTRHLAAAGIEVVEVNRPSRQARRRRGKCGRSREVAIGGQADSTSDVRSSVSVSDGDMKPSALRGRSFKVRAMR